MADHGEVEYATARGNDYPAHEQQYETFVHIAVIGICHIVSVVLALVIGTVLDHLAIMVFILIAATIIAAHGLLTGVRVPSAVMVIISLLLFGLCALT